MTNASQSSMEDGAPQLGAITEEMVNALRGTKGWVQLIGILMLIGAAFTVLAAVLAIFGSAMATMMGAGAGMPRGLFIGVAILYVVMAALYAFLGWYLVSYASAISRLVSKGQAVDMEEALQQQRKFWRLAGVLALVMIVLVIVGIIFGILMSAMMFH